MYPTTKDIFDKFEISHYGFLPVDEPLARLPNAYYKPWEALISQLPSLVHSRSFHTAVSNLPKLNTQYLCSTPEWRRAYVILSFFTHAHIWGGDKPNEILPVQIAQPLLEVSDYLGLPPTATYPALNLWNCGLVEDGADITNPENVVMRHTFTGTQDEAWFYAVSVSVEAKGISAIQIMLECIAAVKDKNDEVVSRCLRAFGQIILKLAQILQRMHEKCRPSVFYHDIRPFLAGSRGMEKVGLPRGLLYQQGNGSSSWRQYSGGSNAQSTLIQFLDIALGVKHHATGNNANSTFGGVATYLDEMRKYMPKAHRDFLEHFSMIANVKDYALANSAPAKVKAAFEDAVDALTAFRDTHIKIVARYIIAPSQIRLVPQSSSVKNIASASSDSSTERNDLKGTGGTNLMLFLKQTRDETIAARDR